MYASHHIIGLTPDDVVYCHLPLYHSSGGQVATCSSILFGTKTVIRRKFSASAFWKDCVGFNITVSTVIIITRSVGRSENLGAGGQAVIQCHSMEQVFLLIRPKSGEKIPTHPPVPSVPPALITILRTQFLRLLLLDHAVSHRIETIFT